MIFNFANDGIHIVTASISINTNILQKNIIKSLLILGFAFTYLLKPYGLNLRDLNIKLWFFSLLR